MRKFVLIDQSIKDSGGHHLEYALRVLKAAKAQGLKTILAVHKNCTPIQNEFIDHFVPTFSHTFWDNVVKARAQNLNDKSKLWNKLKSKKNDLIYEILYSQTSLVLNALRTQSSQEMVNKYQSNSEIGSVSKSKILIAKALLNIGQFVEPIIRNLNRLISKFGFVGKFLKIILLFSTFLILSPLIVVYLFFKLLFHRKSGCQHSELFGKEASKLLVNYHIGANDLVFVPTLSETEILGLLELPHFSKSSSPHWHLLFRRNLFIGREPAYANQFEETQETRIVLNRFKQNKPHDQFYFYTDTDHLTVQYNSLGALTFETLPIPHDNELKKTKTKVDNSPLIISYIGDARSEKGFQFLPKLISDLEAKGIGEERVHYRFQSNFNTPEGEPEPRVAKAMLTNYENNYVELLEGPFNSKEYAALVNNSDIILIPYDSMNYYARSSGILAEALVAGVPVTVPAATWMSSAFSNEVQNYLKRLFEDADRINFSIKSPFINLCIPSQFKKIIVELEWKPSQKGMQCHLDLQRQITSEEDDKKQEMWIDTNVEKIIVESISEKMYCLLQIPQEGCYRIMTSLDNSLESICDEQLLKSQIKNITVKGIQSEIPHSEVGITYSNVDRLSDSVNEIIDHYPHYLKTAQSFKQKWYSIHSAESLVSRLISNSRNGDAL